MSTPITWEAFVWLGRNQPKSKVMAGISRKIFLMSFNVILSGFAFARQRGYSGKQTKIASFFLKPNLLTLTGKFRQVYGGILVVYWSISGVSSLARSLNGFLNRFTCSISINQKKNSRTADTFHHSAGIISFRSFFFRIFTLPLIPDSQQKGGVSIKSFKYRLCVVN